VHRFSLPGDNQERITCCSPRTEHLRQSMQFFSHVKTGAIIYIVIASVLWLAQYHLIFVGSSFSFDESKLPSTSVLLTLSRPAGQTFRVLSAGVDRPSLVVVFFGGNGEHLGALWYRCRQFMEYGALVFAVEYPGYGLSVGPASDTSFREAAEVIGSHARVRADSYGIPMVAVGSSLGGFSALHLVASEIATKAVLHAPFTSMVDVAAHLYWWLPVRQLLQANLTFDNMPTASRIAVRASPSDDNLVLILHGTADEIVAFKFGHTLCDRIQSCEFVSAGEYHHNDLPLHYSGPFGHTIREFLHL